MKKPNSYPFARFFIRIAIFITILILLAGVALSLDCFVQMRAQLKSISYQGDQELESFAQTLQRSYIGTSKRLLNSLDIQSFPDSVAQIDFNKALSEAEKAPNEQQAQKYLDIAKNTQTSINAIKAYHFDQFSSAIDSLTQTLLDKAAELRQRYAQPPSTNQTSQTPQATAPVSAPVGVSPPSGFRIFSDSQDNDDLRLDSLKTVRSLLQALGARSEKQESRDEIRQAGIYLTRAESLLDLLKHSESAPQDQAPTAEQQQATQEEELVSEAEKVAQQLKESKQQLEDKFYSQWQVEIEDQSLMQRAEQDLGAARQAEIDSGLAEHDAFFSVGRYMGGAIALAFFILVIADFLSAFLNMSNNTDMLAALQERAFGDSKQK